MTGLGKQKARVPKGPVSHDEPKRHVYIGHHPIAGPLGEAVDDVWKDLKSSSSSEEDDAATPDPTYHGAVLVGDYYHELAIDSDIDCTYRNGRIEDKGDRWRISEVAETTWNDAAIVQAAHEVIDGMDMGYSLFSNNCQKFTVGLLHEICLPGSMSGVTPSTIESILRRYRTNVKDRMKAKAEKYVERKVEKVKASRTGRFFRAVGRFLDDSDVEEEDEEE